MNRTQHETVVKKVMMLGACATLLLGLPFAFANCAFADPTPKFAYVANLGDDTISAYIVNKSTGALRPVAGSPFAAGSYPSSVTVDPSGRFAYVVNTVDATVSAYAINSSTGALSAVAGSPFATGFESNFVTVDPSGRFAYVANACKNAACATAGDVWAYAINSSTGALSGVPGSPFAAGLRTDSVTVDPSGRFAYAANYGDVTISAYTINSSTGALSAVAGSPFAAKPNPASITVDPTGRFAFVIDTGNYGLDAVSVYTINSSTGALSEIAGSPFAAGSFPSSVTVDPSGRFAYVSNSEPSSRGNVSAYTINSVTGALSRVVGSPFRASYLAASVTVDPTGRFAYVANGGGTGTVSAYTIDQSTGALRAVSGSPYAAGHNANSVAIASQAGVPSVLTLAPRSLDFGDLPINTSSAAQSVTVTNTSPNTVPITGIALRGAAPGQFAFTSNCGKSLAAYRTCTLEASFKPTTVGAKTAYLDVNGGGGGSRSVKLTGTGT